MSTTSLTLRRDYLHGMRRGIIGRALAASLASALPLPFVDDWMLEAILGGGYRAIADRHGVDLDADALKALVHGPARPIKLFDMAMTGIMARLAGKAAKRMMVVLATVDRARAASRTFVTMTLFDHYCARLHRGAALDGRTALLLRDAIAGAIDTTPGSLAVHPFRRGALAVARATLRAPLELMDLASRGALRRVLAKQAGTADPIATAEVVSDVELAVESALAKQESFLARTAAAVELQLSADGNPFLDSAIGNLDRRWKAQGDVTKGGS